jgi:RNA polymerase sigma-70 factor (ECF subfamily)
MKKKQAASDNFLISQYLEGNTDVLPILVKRYHKVFCEKAYWVTKDKELSKDIAQESWIVIINNLHKLKRLDRFKNWAFRIVYTKAIDGVKRKNKESAQLRTVIINETNVPSVEIDRNRIQVALLKAICKLPKGKQDIIRLFYTEEYSINEISTFLNIPIGTVKSRLFKAREKLKIILKNNKS